jgi:anti-sigma28 factor (negative regulator of flagellin synthesis)
MNVQGLGHTNHAESRSAAASKVRGLKSGASKPLFSISDTVELSGSSSDRTELIQQVKKKIKDGYYSTEPVMEDISHGFAKILNQL